MGAPLALSFPGTPWPARSIDRPLASSHTLPPLPFPPPPDIMLLHVLLFVMLWVCLAGFLFLLLNPLVKRYKKEVRLSSGARQASPTQKRRPQCLPRRLPPWHLRASLAHRPAARRAPHTSAPTPTVVLSPFPTASLRFLLPYPACALAEAPHRRAHEPAASGAGRGEAGGPRAGSGGEHVGRAGAKRWVARAYRTGVTKS